MKDPKEMTREELAEKLDALADWLFEEEGKQDENIREAAARLRNSIDRPKVEVEHDAGLKVWSVRLNDQIIFGASYIASEHGDLYARNDAQGMAAEIRLALGMEGGEE